MVQSLKLIQIECLEFDELVAGEEDYLFWSVDTCMPVDIEGTW